MSVGRNTPWTVERAQREMPAEARWEIDEGRLAMREPQSFYHGHATARIAARLHAFVEAGGLGLVAAGDPGFRLARKPDGGRRPPGTAGRRQESRPPRPYTEGGARGERAAEETFRGTGRREGGPDTGSRPPAGC